MHIFSPDEDSTLAFKPYQNIAQLEEQDKKEKKKKN